jgi:DNA-binding transcriptional ArsR family regulator
MQCLTALADPTRQRIVEMLATGALSSGEIARQFAMTAPAVSQHLKSLREARLVRVRAQAEWITRVRSFWSSRLDALEEELHK